MHSHHHGHDHAHHHHPHQGSGSEGSFRWAFFLNLGFALVELVGGILTNSMAVMADALHDFGDALAVGLAWFLEKRSHKAGDARYSYGYRRYSIISALATAIALIVGSLLIVIESLPRLLNPAQPHVEGMFLLSLLGIGVNGFAFVKMSRGRGLNAQVLKWHFVEDIMGWVLVLVSSLVMKFWNLPILDPALAIGLALWVSLNVFKRMKEILPVFLQGTPQHLSLTEIERDLQGLDQVKSVHHTHLWTIDGEQHIFTAHIKLRSDLELASITQLKRMIKRKLQESYGISEANLEFEGANEECSDPNHT